MSNQHIILFNELFRSRSPFEVCSLCSLQLLNPLLQVLTLSQYLAFTILVLGQEILQFVDPLLLVLDDLLVLIELVLFQLVLLLKLFGPVHEFCNLCFSLFKVALELISLVLVVFCFLRHRLHLAVHVCLEFLVRLDDG